MDAGEDDGEICDQDGETNCEIVAGVMTRYLHNSQNNSAYIDLMTPGTQFHFSPLSDVQWCENWHNCRNAYYLEHEL